MTKRKHSKNRHKHILKRNITNKKNTQESIS